jgi:hypothetical protein
MIRTLHTRLTDPAGFAMPIVIVVSMVLMIVAAVAVTSGLNATTSSNRDRQVKVARQAADAGLELALYHINAVMAGQALPCLSRDGAGNMTMVDYSPPGGQWCAPVTDTMADGSTIAYQLSRETPVTGTSPEQVTRRIVATGTYLGQQRRVYTEIRAIRGVTGFFTSGITAKERITAINDAVIGADVRSNGDIRLENHASICGSITSGPGRTISDSSDQRFCNETARGQATSQLVFDDYLADHAAAWTSNGPSNSRLGCGGGPTKDVCKFPGDIKWDASKRELIVDNAAELTLSGDVYSLCRLNLKNNSRLFIAPRPAGSPVKIYFGSPEQCGQTEPIMIENGWGITNNNTDPTTLQFFVRGSSSITTKVNIKNNTVNSAATPILIYAPNSEVMLENNAFFTGGLVGKIVELKNNVRFDFDPNSVIGNGSSALVYQASQHRECSPQPSGAPDTGC